MIQPEGVTVVGTRLLSEAMIKKHNPHLRYVRVHTAGRNAAAIYAWNEALELPDTDQARLRRFAAGYLPPYLCCEVKSYEKIQADRVPRTPELPERVVEAAMNRSLDQHGIVNLINGMLSHGRMTFERYDDRTGTIHYTVRSEGAVTGIERELISQYLYEVVPIGSYFEIAYSD